MSVVLKDHWPLTDPFGLMEDDHPEDGLGIETSYFARAIQVWSGCQPEGASTVSGAALAFHATPDQIRHAVEGNPYMYLNGDQIEHDGE